MKKILSLFAFVFILTTSFSQNSEGHIAYSVDISSEDPEMEMQISMLKGMKMDIYFKDDMTRSVVDMGMLMKMTNITNNKSGKVLMLIEGMIGQKAIQTSLSEMGVNDTKAKDDENVDVKLVKGKKKIAGFKCKKAIVTDENGGEMTYWYTKKIDAKVEGNQFMNNDIPGFPMEISMITKEMSMIFTVENYEEKVSNPSEIFNMDSPEGFEDMPYSEFKKMGM